jgi:hypothetical protein
MRLVAHVFRRGEIRCAKISMTKISRTHQDVAAKISAAKFSAAKNVHYLSLFAPAMAVS